MRLILCVISLGEDKMQKSDIGFGKRLFWFVIFVGLLFFMKQGAYAAETEWNTDITIDSTQTVEDGLYVSDDITLTVNDGATLTVKGGIEIESGYTLTVSGTGTVYVYGEPSYSAKTTIEESNNTLENTISSGAGQDGFCGATGGTGGCSVTGNLTINSGTIYLVSGAGECGENGTNGTDGAEGFPGGLGGDGGDGGESGYIFPYDGSSQLTLNGGSLIAIQSECGFGGYGGRGGKGSPNGFDGRNGKDAQNGLLNLFDKEAAEYDGFRNQASNAAVFLGLVNSYYSSGEHQFVTDDLITSGYYSDGSMLYAITNDNFSIPNESDFSTDYPSASDAGTYYIWYKVVGINDLSEAVRGPVEVYIKKVPLIVEAVDQTISVTGDIDNSSENIYIKGLRGQDTISSYNLIADKENGKITPGNVVIKNGDRDVTANYEIVYRSAVLSIKDNTGTSESEQSGKIESDGGHKTDGLHQEKDGSFSLYLNGKVATDFNDLYFDENYGWWLVRGGKVDFGYSDLFCSNQYGWWLINNGTVDFGYNDLFGSPNYGWWLIEGGNISFGYNDLFWSPQYGWWKIAGSKVDFDYSDLYSSPTYGIWVIDRGAVNFEYNGVYDSLENGKWDVVNGNGTKQISGGHSQGTVIEGLAPYEDGNWYLFRNGQIDKHYSDLYCDPNYGWWLIINGKVAFDYTDLFDSPNYGWWKINGGMVDFSYNDLYGSPTYGWWLIKYGAPDFGYTDLYGSPTYGWWKVNGGCVDFGYDDLYYSPTCGWWKIYSGAVDFGFNDLYCSPVYGWWKVLNGSVDFSYSDVFSSPTCGSWKITGGMVDFGYSGIFRSVLYGDQRIIGGKAYNMENEKISKADIKVGSIVKLGHYEQDNDLSNGKEPIEWQVLDISDDMALLISCYVLDNVRYNDEIKPSTWENCGLRKWMNDQFINAAFSDDEQKHIKTVKLTNEDNKIYGTDGGNDTYDRVFCLSIDEVMKYYTFNTWNEKDDVWSHIHQGYSEELITDATEYAKHVNDSSLYIKTFTEADYNSNYVDYGYSRGIIGKTGAIWRLRSPGYMTPFTCIVKQDGLTGATVSRYHMDENDGNVGVRPAMWVTIE